MKKTILVSLSALAIIAAGCSTRSESSPAPVAAANQPPPKANATPLEGKWVGREVTPGHEAPVSITFSGQTLEFHGADTDDWAKGTFTFREDTSPKQLVGLITDRAAPDIIGKRSNSIFKIEADTLTLSGNGPGD